MSGWTWFFNGNGDLEFYKELPRLNYIVSATFDVNDEYLYEISERIKWAEKNQMKES